jgi:rfaE bifunctional protein kinase chain/domain/rfaE bifunctional protein nucleotidyltransferase chain/domain
MLSNKIINIKELQKIIINLKKKKTVVHCHGVFDLLHIGHIKHFEDAKQKGDILVVTITSDKYVNKGPNRPYFNTFFRAESVAAIQMVDYVSISNTSSAVDIIKKIKPDIYFKGSEYKNAKSDLTGMIKKEKLAIKSVGGKIKYSDQVTFSSSQLLNKYAQVLTDDQKLFIQNIKKKFTFDKIKKIIQNLEKTKVLIIGETIIDEYHFCEALGKSGKEPVLVFKDYGKEEYLGGVLAIARHLSSFCKAISVLSLIGENREKEIFIKNSIEKNIKLNFLKKKGSPTIIKKRFIDKVDNRKVFGLYSLDDKYISLKEESVLIKKLKSLYKNYDLVIVADYGHGMITSNIAKFISKQKRFFSLNAQVNSTNIGLKSIYKYSHINSLTINAAELKYEMNDREGDLLKLSKKFKSKIKPNYLNVTNGKNGALSIDNKNKITRCPAFATNPVDKIGAGDAFFSIMSLCQYNKYDTDFSLFLSSLAAAKSANTIGNKYPINKSNILKTISHLLK